MKNGWRPSAGRAVAGIVMALSLAVTAMPGGAALAQSLQDAQLLLAEVRLEGEKVEDAMLLLQPMVDALKANPPTGLEAEIRSTSDARRRTKPCNSPSMASISWRKLSRLGESIRPLIPVSERRYYVRAGRVKARNFRALAQFRRHPYRSLPWNLSRPACGHVKPR